MKCPGCKGNMKKGKTNFPVELSGGLLYIKSVPSDVCTQCGEVYISDKIAESLEKIVSNARKNKIEIEVISFEKVA